MSILSKGTTRRLFYMVLILLLLTVKPSHAQFSATGTWKNNAEGVKLSLRADQTGTYERNGKVFVFNEPYKLNAVNTDRHLEFKITLGTETKTMYAILRKINSTQVRFIVFVSKEMMDNATDEMIESGIVLTKNND